jgi:hypothetical protein
VQSVSAEGMVGLRHMLATPPLGMSRFRRGLSVSFGGAERTRRSGDLLRHLVSPILGFTVIAYVLWNADRAAKTRLGRSL